MTLPTSVVPAAARGPLPHERCPHCGNVAVIEPSSSLRFVCGVCGKARVPIDDADLTRTFAEAPALARASSARNAAAAWTVGSAVSAGFGALSLLVLLLVVLAAHPPLIAELAAFVASITPILFAAFGLVRAKARRAEVEPALDEGWMQATRDAIEGLGTTRAETLAGAMRITPDTAERHLISLSVEGAVRSRVLDEGALEFEAMAPRARVAALPPPAEESLATDDTAEERSLEAKKETR